MSRRKPSYTQLALAARAIHETHYALRHAHEHSWCEAAHAEMMEIRNDPLNPKYLDLIIIELAATFDYADAISLKDYIKYKLKFPDKRFPKSEIRPVSRTHNANPKKAKTKANGHKTNGHKNGYANGHHIVLKKPEWNYHGLYMPMAMGINRDEVQRVLIDDPELVWG